MKDTLTLIKEKHVMLAIVNKCNEAGYEIIEADEYHVKAKANCLPVDITWEQCLCHGGRMWFSQENTGICLELSSQEYDTDNGIIDSTTELAYYIDNVMLDKIKEFTKYVYVVVVKDCDADGKETTYHYRDVQSAAKYIFEQPGHDPNSEYGVVEIQTLKNERFDWKTVVRYNGEDKQGIHFHKEKYENGKLSRESDITFKVFRKG